MKELFPEIEPFSSDYITVAGGHEIYVEQCGNPAGLPVIFLHGGPGSGCNENHRRYFDPARYHIIIFDQRGCHRSRPAGCIENNTIQDLINDMEVIRNTLDIDQWILFGGSWGATLALAYAELHTKKVMGMILRGSFLARKQDLDWFVRSGANRLLPDAWAEFVKVIPDDERDDLITAYHEKYFGGDKQQSLQCAQAWSTWATKVVTYHMNSSENRTGESEDKDPELERQKILNETAIELHYAKNQYFLQENQLLANIDTLKEIFMELVHGRLDITCPVQSSWLLHDALPGSNLTIVPNGGHLAGEPPMVDALITATNQMADHFT